jgi:hypothetical protein
MRVRKRDWQNLQIALPGVVPVEQEPAVTGCVYSIGFIDGEWAIFRGTIVRRSADNITERIDTIHKGTPLQVSLELEELGFSLPLFEQLIGELRLPSPRDLYFKECCRRLPGRFLKVFTGNPRYGMSLTPARRKGWKLHYFDEVDESALLTGSYLKALVKGEYPDVHVLGGWEGRQVGSRGGVIPDNRLDEVLGWLDIDMVTELGLTRLDRDTSDHTRKPEV